MTTSDYLTQLQTDKSTMVTNLTTKGISGLTGDETFTELVPEILNIPSGGGGEVEEKDVNFYDYDGTRLYSYTAQEFMALSELPANPSHEGLTAQGWNATLSQIQSEVGTHGWFNVGQLYVTDDGKTRIYTDFSDVNNLSFYFGIGINGSVTIDWGDNSATETVSGSNLYTFQFIQHTYSTTGQYMITVSGSTYLFGGTNDYNSSSPTINGSYILNYNNTTSRTLGDTAFLPKIKKIEIGTGITQFYQGAFRNLANLESITIPNTITSIGASAFEFCNSLNCVVSKATIIALAFNCSAVKHILNYGTTNCLSYVGNKYQNKQYIFGDNVYGNKKYDKIEEAYISNTLTTLGGEVFAYCTNLKKVHFGKNLTRMYQKVFDVCLSISELDFRNALSVPTINSTTFTSEFPAQCKIVVPDSLYSSWISANYWSNVSSQIVKASQA